MRTTRFTDEQIAFALLQAETGVAVAEVCRKLGINEATIDNWKRKFGGLGVGEVRRLEAACGGEWPPQASGCGPESGQGNASGCRPKKTMTPARRRELAQFLI